MKTITVQIGNSDDKLTQKEWSNFARDVGVLVSDFAFQIHFSGTSGSIAPWQNATWVFVLHPDNNAPLRENLSIVREKYRQKSVAWTEGDTLFV